MQRAAFTPSAIADKLALAEEISGIITRLLPCEGFPAAMSTALHAYTRLIASEQAKRGDHA